MGRYRRTRLFWKRLAPVVTLAFLWTAVAAPALARSTAAPGAQTAAERPCTRTLTAAEMADTTGTITWNYDAANRATSLVQPNGTVSYSYDDASRVTSRTLTGTGSWSYTSDAGNRVTATTNPYNETTSVTYNAANLPTQVTAGNSSTTSTSYDSLLRPTDVSHKTSGNVTLGRYQYAYDSASNVYTRADDDGSTTTFGYDAANPSVSIWDETGGRKYID